MIEDNSVQKIINDKNTFIENEDHMFAQNLQMKNSNENDIATFFNKTENSTKTETSNGGEKLFALNQSHDSICESCNSFHNLEMNTEIFKALNGSIEINNSIQNNNVLFSKPHANVIGHVENNTTNMDLNVVDQDQSLTSIETITPDQILLDCPNRFEYVNPLENIANINSKQVEIDHDVTKQSDLGVGNQILFDKKDKTKGYRSSQRLLHEAMSKKLSEADTIGLRPCRTASNCTPELKVKSKEDGIKHVGK